MVYDERAEKRDGLKCLGLGVLFVALGRGGVPEISSHYPKKGGRNMIRRYRWDLERGPSLIAYRSTKEHVERWVARKRLQFPGLRVVVEEE